MKIPVHISTIILSIFLSLMYFNTLFAEEKIRIAILDLKAKNVSKETVEILNDIMVVEIQSFKQLSIISKKEIETMLGFEAQKQMVGCEDDISCIVEIVGAYGVKMLVAGSVGKVGKTYVINLQLINIRTASVDNRVYKRVKGEEDELLDSIPIVVKELMSVVEVKKLPIQEEKIKPVIKPQIEEVEREPAKPEKPKKNMPSLP